MKTLTAIAFAAAMVVGVAAEAHRGMGAHRTGASIVSARTGTSAAEGPQNTLYYMGAPCPCPQQEVASLCPREPVCPEVCPPVCPPEPVCPPLCCADFRGYFDGYQCPCAPMVQRVTVPCAPAPCPC